MATTQKKPGKGKTPSHKKKTAVKKKPSAKKSNGRRPSANKKKQQTLSPKAVRILVICAVLVLLIVLIAVLAGKCSGGRRSTIQPPDKEIAWGIDVSSYNGDIDWETVASQADFAFVRVGYRGYTYGEITEDKLYKDNLKGANQNGVPVGVYFYTQAVSEAEAEEEAQFALDAVKGYNITLPVVIDFEYPQKKGKHTGRLWDAQLSKKERTAVINAFCDTVRKAGYTPAIYASTYIYESQLNLGSIEDDVFIWVADYNPEITYDGYYDIWQYSAEGSCDGVDSKYVDTDYWYTKNRLNG